jgi:hypothetical protein
LTVDKVRDKGCETVRDKGCGNGMRTHRRGNSAEPNKSTDRIRAVVRHRLPALLCWLVACGLAAAAAPERVEVSDLAAFAEAAAGNGRHIVLAPGVYRMADYLTDEVLEGIRAGVDRTQRRPPVPMMVIGGDRNTFELRARRSKLTRVFTASSPAAATSVASSSRATATSSTACPSAIQAPSRAATGISSPSPARAIPS